MEPFLGQILIVGFTFPPRGWATCGGQIMSIAQNSALFSLLGTTYGGNGQVTFGLPNLGGRTPIGQGQSPGTSLYVLGQMSGVENTTLLTQNMPMHQHTATTSVAVDASGVSATTTINAVSAPTARAANPAGNVLTVPQTSGASPVAVQAFAAPTAGAAVTMAPEMATTALHGAPVISAATTVQPAGGSQPFSILQPYIAMNYIIATDGIFPSRN